MKLLLNDCYRTEIKVYPKNWNTKKASLTKKWYIWYRFYDPAYKHLYKGKGKLVRIKGMNVYEVLVDRQENTRQSLQNECDLIDVKNYNPFTGKSMQPPAPAIQDQPVAGTRPITPATPFITALDWAYENVKVGKATMDNLKSVLTYAWQAADHTGLSSKRIMDIEKSDIRILLEKVGEIKKEKWSENSYNYYRSHLGILYSFLEEFDVYKINPMLGIKKRKVTKNIREVLTQRQFDEIGSFIKDIDYYFWRFIHIFHRSGGRRPEILGVQDTHVDLAKRRYKVFIKKGREFRWEWKDIEDDVLCLWREVMKEASALKKKYNIPVFLFSVGLQPRFRLFPIRPEQVTKRWRVHIKKKLGITADLYSLKHFNTTTEIDEMVDAAIEKAQRKVAKKNNHTTTAMVKGVYDVKARHRRAVAIRKAKAAQ